MALFSSSEDNPISPLVAKATDSNQTAENWELILDVCDKVNEQLENGPRWAMSSIMRRLADPNANVQIYTLTLISSLAQNCGSKMLREIASKQLCDRLYDMCGDRNVHNRVKTKIASTLETLDKEMAKDPSLKIVHETLVKVQNQYPLLAAGPAKPKKQEITQSDRQREEEELQMVLALSLAEAEGGNGNRQSASGSGTGSGSAGRQQSFTGTVSTSSGYSLYEGDSVNNRQTQNQEQQNDNPQRHTAATVTRVRALYDLNASEDGELSFRKGDIIHVIESVYRDWWRGSLRGEVGIFPLNYVTPLPEPTVEELEKEAQDELNVLAQSRNIEKLLSLLSSTDPNDAMRITENEDLQNLYHSTLSLRPKLARLIEKYSQKRDDLMNLNDKFLSARRTYEQLMEQSINHATHSSQNSAYSMSPPPPPPPQSASSSGSLPQGYHQGYPPPSHRINVQQQHAPAAPNGYSDSNYPPAQSPTQQPPQRRPSQPLGSPPPAQYYQHASQPQQLHYPASSSNQPTAPLPGHRLPYPVNEPPTYR